MTINTDKLGWLVAAALAGAMSVGALSGFQGNTAPKFASVDIAKVFDESTLAATNTDAIEAARKQRAGILEFVNQNRAMEAKDAQRFADLSLKATPSAAEKTEIDKLKAAGTEATRKQRELQTKNPLTDADKALLQDYAAKVQANNALLGQLQGKYEGDLQNMLRDSREKTLGRVRDVIKSIAAKGGYTVVFSSEAAPYAATDLTGEALKALK
ncbi:OmpH family outer membrane protein [bacterium]|nr:MAG: OmpH family outer membrane protein [bacterium]